MSGELDRLKDLCAGDGERIDLSKVRIPLYFQASREDHIAPMNSVYRSARLFGGASPRLEFPEPQFGVSPGQAAVCYEGSRVLGGAFIRAAR